jgi:hypothetical protein
MAIRPYTLITNESSKYNALCQEKEFVNKPQAVTFKYKRINIAAPQLSKYVNLIPLLAHSSAPEDRTDGKITLFDDPDRIPIS